MKKFIFVFAIIFSLVAAPALAATKKTPVPAKPAYKAVLPPGYTAIDWAKATGVVSYYKAPTDNGAIDFLTRINLRQNEINFIIAPDIAPVPDEPTGTEPVAEITTGGIASFPNFSFKRIVGEASKAIDPAIKFVWDAPFFNMGAVMSDLSMAVKYTLNGATTINSGTRSAADMALPRRMLTVDNKNGKAVITDFDETIFTDVSKSDQALEGFSPAVTKSDGPGGPAARLFLGVSDDGQELAIYCSRSATVKEASEALTNAGIPPERQLQADGGGSAACGYNLPGQFFVEPARTLPMLMGAKTIMKRSKVTNDTLNVRSGPGTKYSIISKLTKNDPIIVYGELNGWYRIGDGRWIIKTMVK